MMDERMATSDEVKGMEWWNGLTEEDRDFWLRVAGSAVPADAWSFFKHQEGIE